MDTNSILNLGKETLRIEKEALENLLNSLDASFVQAVECLQACTGRVVITGIGKSAIVAQKIVATFNSTGTPALFLHAADAIHGDLGMVNEGDVVICISKSGNSPEIKALVPLIRAYGNQVVGMVAGKDSFLALNSDFQLFTPVDKEACPNNLAPTTSTTLQMAIGDALAVVLMTLKNFGSRDFAKYHPGGALGKKLYLTIGDLIPENTRSVVTKGSPMNEVIVEISKNRQGAVAVEENGVLIGMVTDGDLRRMLEKEKDWQTKPVEQFMTPTPIQAKSNELAFVVFQRMEAKNITQIPVVSEEGKLQGLVHLHDILKEGIF